jgi:hypothetical protein
MSDLPNFDPIKVVGAGIRKPAQKRTFDEAAKHYG